jgi:hydrogenase maturation protease
VSDAPRILVACIGNIFLGDDAFGVEVARRLLTRPWPASVRIEDFGIRGLDLTYALLDAYDAVILVDAAPRGRAPGTLYVIEPEPGPPDVSAPGAADALIDTHALDPAKVLRLAAAMGGRVRRVILIGCEPAPAVPEDDMQMGLSPPVQAAVDEAAKLVGTMVAGLLAGTAESRATSHS